MIRTRKSPDIPASLQVQNCNAYNGQDVQEQLLEDHDGKCYLCEQNTSKSFQIEHLRAKAQDYFPELKYEWTNLFLVCPYCNGRKSNALTQIHPPHTNNIELLIEQRIIFSKNNVCFQSTRNDEATKETIELLDKLLNGKNNIRDVKCQVFYQDVKREILFFMKCLNQYKLEPTASNEQIVIDCLGIKKEFLGIKYWTLKQYNDLFETFEQYCHWNRIEI